MYNDTYTRYNRIGDHISSNWYKQARTIVIWVSAFVILMMFISTLFINQATAREQYKSALAQTRYENIKK